MEKYGYTAGITKYASVARTDSHVRNYAYAYASISSDRKNAESIQSARAAIRRTRSPHGLRRHSGRRDGSGSPAPRRRRAPRRKTPDSSEGYRAWPTTAKTGSGRAVRQGRRGRAETSRRRDGDAGAGGDAARAVAYQNALMPVSSRPTTSWCTVSVPS